MSRKNRVSYRGDFITEVRKGNVPGHEMISIRGHDETVPMGGPFDLSPQFGTNSYVFNQSVIAATAGKVSVASTDDTKDDVGNVGALTLRIFGLDASGDRATEDVTLLGQTKVETDATWTAVYDLLVLTTGSENDNSGIIYCGTGNFSSGVPAVRMLSMEPSHNKAFSAYYVVPTGKVLILQQLITTLASSNKEAEVRLMSSLDGIQWTTQGPFGIEAGDFGTDIIAIPAIPAGVHFKMSAEGSASGTVITAIVAGLLIDV